MNQRRKDGIIIDNSVYMIDEKKEGFPLYLRLLQLFVVIIGSWSVISTLIESYSIPVSIFKVNIAIVLISITLFLLILYPLHDLVKAILLILFYGLFCYSRLKIIKNAFYIIENLFINRFSSYYGYLSVGFEADYSKAQPDTTLFIIMIIIPMIALLATVLIRNKFRSICNVILFLPVAASFAIGIIPSERYLIIYIIVILFITISHNSSHQLVSQEQKTLLLRVNSRAAVWLSLICLGIFALAKLFVTPEKYNEVTEIPNAKIEIQDYMSSFSIEDFTDSFSKFELPTMNKGIGGLSGGQLGEVGEVIYFNTEHLRVSAPLFAASEGIYLKGYVGSEYTGDSWEGHTKEDSKKYKELLKKLPEQKFSPVNQVNDLLNQVFETDTSKGQEAVPSTKTNYNLYQFYKGKISVEYLHASKNYIYAPYYTDYNNVENAEYRTDLYPAPKTKKDSYEFDCYLNISLGDKNPFTNAFPAKSSASYQNISKQLADYSGYEKLYRDYVYDVYTKLPEKGLERLKQDFSSENVNIGTNSISERINYIKDYLEQNTQYTLAPGKLPKDKDYVEYFLYENKLGYCSHYASSATLMLRAMGIPARYVEGYAIGASDILQEENPGEQMVTEFTDQGYYEFGAAQVMLSAKDYNAHAWVEVYIDGSGWIPVEFTPAAAIETSTAQLEGLQAIGRNLDQNSEEQATPTDTPAEVTPQAENTEQVVQPTVQPDQEVNSDSNQKMTGEQVKQKVTQLFKDLTLPVALLLIAVAIAAVGILIVCLMLHIQRKRSAKLTSNHSKKALILYTEIEKIISFCHGLPKRGVHLEEYFDYVKENFPNIDQEAFTSCIETVQRARFGKGRISLGELKVVESFHSKLYTKAYQGLPFGKKVYLKFILFI